MTSAQVWKEIDVLKTRAEKAEVLADVHHSRDFYLGAVEALRWILSERDSLSEERK